MNVLEAILLGAIQGIAEFLPISSSGHLAIAQALMDLREIPLLFDILLHLATLAAVCAVFRARIAALFLAFARWVSRRSTEADRGELSTIVALLVATAITAVIGFLVKDAVESLSPFWISLCLVATGIMLLVSGKFAPKKTIASPGVLQGVVIGVAQGVGVVPGISRSGSTISAALLCGLDRKAAGDFSFLLSIPTILGAFILELKDADTLTGAVSIAPLVAGMLTAFVVGYVSLKILLGLINRGKLGWFAVYLVPAGLALAIHFAGVF